jgi:hypothetical protein
VQNKRQVAEEISTVDMFHPEKKETKTQNSVDISVKLSSIICGLFGIQLSPRLSRFYQQTCEIEQHRWIVLANAIRLLGSDTLGTTSR